MSKASRKKRIPKLKYTETRNIGWHVSYRDPKTGTPRKHPFKVKTRGEAEKLYHEWVTVFLKGELPDKDKRKKRQLGNPDVLGSAKVAKAKVTKGSLLHVASSFLIYEQSRIRKPNEPRQSGKISEKLYNNRKYYTEEVLTYFNSRYGEGSVSKMKFTDVTMEDVEEYNKKLVEAGYSQSQVSKQLQFLKTLVDRAGRPEHGSQVLSWNWNARDKHQGKQTLRRKLPTLKQLKLILGTCSLRETAMVWMAIGCGFGQGDLAGVRIGHIDIKSYDLRRGKTGIERFGDTPLMVWNAILAYLKTVERSPGELMFMTRQAMPLVSRNSDSVARWWSKLRTKLGDDGEGLCGFYTLRHLGATEFGSRPGCSIGDIKRWLGHSVSSHIADVYMKPISPEDRPVIEWVRKCLKSGECDLRIGKKKKQSKKSSASKRAAKK